MAATTNTITIASASLSLEPFDTPTSTLASSEMLAAIDRSMPPIMMTSIWPRATIATTLPSGSSELHDADESVLGATILQISSSTAIAIQIVTKRVPNSRLLSSVPHIEASPEALTGVGARAADVCGRCHPRSPSVPRLLAAAEITG